MKRHGIAASRGIWLGGLLLCLQALPVSALTPEERRKAEEFWSSVGGQLPPPAQPVTVGAGSIAHEVHSVEVIDTIPASWTIPKFARIARRKPAPAGHVWYVIKGRATNRGENNVGMSAAGYRIMDDQGRDYQVDVKNAAYQPANTVLTYRRLDPGESSDWLGYFPVPKDARGLRLRLSDLSLAAKDFVYLALPDPDGRGPSLTETDHTPSPPASIEDPAPSAPSAAPVTAGNTASVGLSATTGEVEHTVVSLQRLAALPPSLWSRRWRDAIPAEELPAPEGHTWLRIVGQATNNSSQDRSFKASFLIVDEAGREFPANTRDTQFYTEDGESLLATAVAAGQTRRWVGYFAVPVGARGLRLKLDDLTFLAEHTALVALPDEG